MIQLVCFDLGRVLVRICDGWRQASGLAGIPLPEVEPSPEAMAQLRQLGKASDTGALNHAAFAETVAQLFGLTAAQVSAVSNAWLLGAFPGVHELLDDLEAAGMPTACLSNTNENHWRIMNDPAHPSAMPLHRLTHRFASHLMRVRKPDAAIYEQFERETGIAGPHIAFFDDLADNVAAARLRGWHAVQIDTATDPIAQIRHSLRQLKVFT